jgi:hypothetical protein
MVHCNSLLRVCHVAKSAETQANGSNGICFKSTQPVLPQWVAEPSFYLIASLIPLSFSCSSQRCAKPINLASDHPEICGLSAYSKIIENVRHCGENMHGRNREREGNLKFECGWCAHCWGVNKVILNEQRPLWEGDQKYQRGVVEMNQCGL